MSGPRRSGVSAVPNAGKVRGKLVNISTEADGAAWEIAVEESQDVDGSLNFARSYVGKQIEVFVPQRLRHVATANDEIEACVEYRGDERGGRFVLVNDDVRKLA